MAEIPLTSPVIVNGSGQGIFPALYLQIFPLYSSCHRTQCDTLVYILIQLGIQELSITQIKNNDIFQAAQAFSMSAFERGSSEVC